MVKVDSYTFSLFFELMPQNGSNIDFVDDIDLAFFSGYALRASYDDPPYQFITHFAGQRRRFEIFLYVPYKVIGALYRALRFCKPLL